MIKRHLAIFDLDTAHRILAGKKTIETRFSQKKISPFGEVSVGDIVYIKPVGSELAGQFIISKVIFYDGLDSSDLADIRQLYGKRLSLGSTEADDKFFDSKKDAKFGTIIFISQVERFITPPIKIPKKDRRGWVVLDI